MANQATKQGTGYGALLRSGGFQSFLWTQFLGAFNDNVYKMIVSVGAVALAADQASGARYIALAGSVFVLPFLLFAGYAGQIADRFSKTRVLQITKACEMLAMLVGMLAFTRHSVPLMLFALFLLALQANFFSPAKYGILPEVLGEAQLARANGLLELSTFAAVVLGTSAGALLFAHWKNQPLSMGAMMLGIAVLGSLTSIWIPKAAPCGSREPFRWNPFAEVWMGTRRIFADRWLWLTVIGISYFWFAGALFQMNVIVLGREALHLSDTDAGLLVTALAVGIGIGSIAAGWLSGDRVEVGMVPCGATVLGLAAAGLGFTHSFGASLGWLALAGIGGGLFIVPLNAYLQHQAADTEKGRLQATNNFFNMIGVILASGALYGLHDLAHVGAPTIFVYLGAATLVAAVYVTWLLRLPLVRFGLSMLLRVFFRIRVTGAENIPATSGALIVANHVSYADALLLGCVSPRFIRFLMWQPMFENRWLNPICRLFQAIPLAQGAPKEALRALRSASAEIRAGEIVCIFPEGELTRTAQVNPFERGAELIIRGMEAVPVIPVYLDGLWGHALSKKSGRLRFRHPVTIAIGEALTGKVTAEQMYQSVLALGPVAAEGRKDDTATLGHRFVDAAKRNWSATAMVDSTGKRLSFGECLTAALLLKNWVSRNCANSGSVGLLFPASVAGALANCGVTLAGKTAVNLNFTSGENAMKHAIAKCGIQTILTSRVFCEKAQLPVPDGAVFLEDVMPSFTKIQKALAFASARLLPTRYLAGGMKPDDLAAVIFSSGSTGTPKGVMLSHWNLLSNADATGQVYSVNQTDCMLGVLPFFHSFGYTYGLWFPLIHGFKAVFHSNPVDAKTIGELAGEHRPTLFLSTPTFCMSYLRRCTREQFASIRHLLVGAEKLRPKLAAAFEERFGITLLEGYGCTEMGPAVSVNVVHQERSGFLAGSVGRPLPNISVRIVDPETFAPLPVGETGLLLVQGPSRMLGYLGDEERTAQVLRSGYYITGDLALVDHEGFLHIGDRLSRFSKIAGEMVPHLKIEEVIDEILKSRACVVAGIPDEQRGERLAILYTATDISPAELWRRLTETDLPKLWIPKRDNVYAVDSIPTLGTGKVDLRAVKAKVLELSAHADQVIEVVS